MACYTFTKLNGGVRGLKAIVYLNDGIIAIKGKDIDVIDISGEIQSFTKTPSHQI